MKNVIKILMGSLAVLAITATCYAAENNPAATAPFGRTLRNIIQLQQTDQAKKSEKMTEHLYYLPVEQAPLLNKNTIERN